MQKYIKNFMQYHGYTTQDFIPCMVCGNQSVDIHHIVFRSRAHKDMKDHVSNLLSCCRQCHDKAHNEIFSVEYLLDIVHSKIKEKDKLTEKEIRYGK